MTPSMQDAVTLRNLLDEALEDGWLGWEDQTSLAAALDGLMDLVAAAEDGSR